MPIPGTEQSFSTGPCATAPPIECQTDSNCLALRCVVPPGSEGRKTCEVPSGWRILDGNQGLPCAHTDDKQIGMARIKRELSRMTNSVSSLT